MPQVVYTDELDIGTVLEELVLQNTDFKFAYSTLPLFSPCLGSNLITASSCTYEKC